MSTKITNNLANRLVNAFLKKKLIKPIPNKYTKKMHSAEKFKNLCESKISKPIIGFKAGGTGIPLLKKLKEKEPFYAKVYKHNFLTNNKSVKINNYTLGIELEVCYFINKDFFKMKKFVSLNKINNLIKFTAPCIEIVGYRQKKKGIKTLGDLCSDFGGNVKFVIGSKKTYKKINTNNLKTTISNSLLNHSVSGNTNTVYKNPLNALKFVLNKMRKHKIKHDKDFFVFTGSTVGVVPILGKGTYTGKINKLGSVKVKIV